MSLLPEVLLVYVTHPDHEQALQLARLCLEQKLIACANISSPVDSLYRWEGEICRDREWVLILKTEQRYYQALEQFIVQHHPADCPCVLAIPVDRGHGPYLQWLGESL